MQRSGIIILAVVLLAIAGIATYFVFFRTSPGVTTETPGNMFGISGEYTGPIGEPGDQPLGEIDGEAGEEVAPRLVRITEGPVAYGALPFTVRETVPDTSASGIPASTISYDTEVRFLERASGNAYAYRAHARTLARISNKTLPGVYDAAWLTDGTLAYARFLSGEGGVESIETYALPVSSEKGGYFLEAGLSSVVVQGTTTIAALLPSTNGAIATVASPSGTTARTLFSSTLSDLRLLFSGEDFVAFTKASANVNGYAFLVDGASGAFERILGPFRGLTALPSPSGDNIFYTYLSGNVARAGLLDATARTSTTIPLGAFSEKCVWAPDETAIYCAVPRTLSGTLPDDWYQGATSFSDRLWRIDLAGRVAVLVIDPLSVAKTDIDAVNLSIDERADLLVFTNKKDGSLWAYDL